MNNSRDLFHIGGASEEQVALVLSVFGIDPDDAVWEPVDAPDDPTPPPDLPKGSGSPVGAYGRRS